MSGRRLSRSVPPIVGQRVMTKLGTRGGEVLRLYEDDASAAVLFPPGPPVRVPVAHLYDATDLITFDAAAVLFRNGCKLSYVIPGFVHISVHDLYREGERCIAEIGLRGKTRVEVKPLAPRFCEVKDDASR